MTLFRCDISVRTKKNKSIETRHVSPTDSKYTEIAIAAGTAYSAPPDPLARFKGPLRSGEGRTEWRGYGRVERAGGKGEEERREGRRGIDRKGKG